jgi:5S rRNA maturation endonuclease (ribonuclease M5)
MKTMTKKTKSPLNDQYKLKIICDEVCDNISSLLDAFEIEYKTQSKMIVMACPIHGGDNTSALNLYPEGDTYRGNWKCRTHNCEKIFKGSILGFIRGIISRHNYGWRKPGDETCSFQEAVNYALSFIKKDIKEIKISRVEKEKKQFTNVINNINKNVEASTSQITRAQIVKSLEIPAQYYLDRNYSSAILTKYDVGLCTKANREMSDRIVVPIYDNDYKFMIGCSGRSIYEKCTKCKSHHNQSDTCPSQENVWKYPKWKHNADFKSQNTLYNFWFAKEHILNSATAIIVESPGNVWRLEENGIHNSVAMFGSSLSDRQKILLDSSGAMNLVILTDNDEAGHKAAQQIKQKCQNTYRVFIPLISESDVGEMSPEQINEQIKKYLERII